MCYSMGTAEPRDKRSSNPRTSEKPSRPADPRQELSRDLTKLSAGSVNSGPSSCSGGVAECGRPCCYARGWGGSQCGPPGKTAFPCKYLRAFVCNALRLAVEINQPLRLAWRHLALLARLRHGFRHGLRAARLLEALPVTTGLGCTIMAGEDCGVHFESQGVVQLNA